MKYVDYDWDLYPNGIKLDEEINVAKLTWNPGDVFQLVEIDGQRWLRRLDAFEKFVNKID